MRRAATIILVLMGGGAGLAAFHQTDQCRQARARHAPDADTICGHGGGYAHASSGGWHSGTGGTTTSSIARGGFGRAGFFRFGG